MTNNAPHEHAEALTQEARERKWPNVTPKDAATLIIIDRTTTPAKVLMGKRHHGHKFMPGKFVFPGGRIERTDSSMNVAGTLAAPVEDKLQKLMQRPSITRARGLALAAVRETFEETGLLIGVKDHGVPPSSPEGPWREFASHGVYPDLEPLHFIARAITPPRRPKRFDARFFAVDAKHIAHRIEGVVSPDTELVDLVWQPIGVAIELDLPSITRIVLKELEARIEAGFGHHLPTPFFHEKNRRWYRDLL